MRQIRNVPRQTPLARSFFDAAFLRAQGPAQLFPLIKRRRGKASDAVLSLRYIASRFVVGGTSGDSAQLSYDLTAPGHVQFVVSEHEVHEPTAIAAVMQYRQS
jgi:hypothetical protein